MLLGLAGAALRTGHAHTKQKKGKVSQGPIAAAQENGDSSKAAAFIQAANFQELRAGYVFKSGPSGTGYYSDK